MLIYIVPASSLLNDLECVCFPLSISGSCHVLDVFSWSYWPRACCHWLHSDLYILPTHYHWVVWFVCMISFVIMFRAYWPVVIGLCVLRSFWFFFQFFSWMVIISICEFCCILLVIWNSSTFIVGTFFMTFRWVFMTLANVSAWITRRL